MVGHTNQVGPLRVGHLAARARLCLHAGRVHGGCDRLAVLHLDPAPPHHTAILAHGQADARVATLHLTRGDGGAREHRRGLAHVHPAARGPVGRVRVTAGLHHPAVTSRERAVARDAAVQGGEDGRDEVLDLHGSVFPGLWPNGYVCTISKSPSRVNRVDAK